MSKDELLQMIIDYYDMPIRAFEDKYPGRAPEGRFTPCYVWTCRYLLKQEEAKSEKPVFKHDYRDMPRQREWKCLKCGDTIDQRTFNADTFDPTGCTQ